MLTKSRHKHVFQSEAWQKKLKELFNRSKPHLEVCQEVKLYSRAWEAEAAEPPSRTICSSLIYKCGLKVDCFQPRFYFVPQIFHSQGGLTSLKWSKRKLLLGLTITLQGVKDTSVRLNPGVHVAFLDVHSSNIQKSTYTLCLTFHCRG